MPECVWMACECVCVDEETFGVSLQDVQYNKQAKLAGRGSEDLEPDGLFNMEDIPVLPA